MERKNFIQGIGLVGIGALLPSKQGKPAAPGAQEPYACTLTPQETEGPYPYNGTIETIYNTSPIYRVNLLGDLPVAGGGGTISGGRTSGGGVVMTITLTLQNQDCTPLQGGRVDIWHCDKRGYYSGYNSSQNGGDWSSYTFLRGIQTTDSNGQVTFITIFPGWYIPRAIHFHINAYMNNTLLLTTQLALPDSICQTVNNTVYGRTYTYTNSTDQVFSGSTSDLALEMMTISGDTTNGYVASRTLTITYTALPLKLLSFNAGFDSGKTSLWWSVAEANNVSHFEVEKSSDSITYNRIGSVAAINGSSVKNYSFTDTSVAGDTTFYRLKMIDLDGRFQYSNVVPVSNKAMQSITAYPNPARDKLVITHPRSRANSSFSVLKLDGRVVAKTSIPANITSSSIDVSALSAGTYLLIMESAGEKYVIKFSKL